jgi:predicted dehydrogenase
MSDKISVGVVGCGYWGPNLIRNFSRLPNAQVSGICDFSEERRKHMASLYPSSTCYSDFDEMLKNGNLDAVVVATPVKSHFPLAKAALLAGKHVLVEKPMAASTAECEELVKLADSKGLILMVSHTFLYSEPIHRITEIVSMGDIGEILYINSQRLNLGLFQKDINVAWDLAPHDISIILHILGQTPDTVNCQGNAHITPGIEDVTNMSLNFGGKHFATVQSSWLEPRKVRQMTIVGSRRMIVYDDLEPREKIRLYDVRVERPPHYDTFGEFHYSYHYGDCYIPHLQQEEPLKVMCQHFLDCIDKGTKPLSCGRQGTQLVRVLEACSESLASGGGAVKFSHSIMPAAPVNESAVGLPTVGSKAK